MWASVVWEQEIGERDIVKPQFGYVGLSGLGARDRRERDIDIPQLGYVGLSGLGARDRTEGH